MANYEINKKVLWFILSFALITGILAGFISGKTFERAQAEKLYLYSEHGRQYCEMSYELLYRKLQKLTHRMSKFKRLYERATVFYGKGGRVSCVEFRKNAVERNFILANAVSSRKNKGIIFTPLTEKYRNPAKYLRKKRKETKRWKKAQKKRKRTRKSKRRAKRKKKG